jgi:hypothetical protein
VVWANIRAGQTLIPPDGEESPPASATVGGDTTTFFRVTFPKPFKLSARRHVVVVANVQTFNGPDTPGLRVADVDHTGFSVRMNEIVRSTAAAANEPLSDGWHGAEVIGWIAWAPRIWFGPPPETFVPPGPERPRV